LGGWLARTSSMIRQMSVLAFSKVHTTTPTSGPGSWWSPCAPYCWRTVRFSGFSSRVKRVVISSHLYPAAIDR
jgi:hypothetical protein